MRAWPTFGVLTLGLVLVPAPGSAFHGGPYELVGDATRSGVDWPMILKWTGSFGSHEFTVTIATAPPLRETFSGQEDVSSVRIEGCWEIVEPYYAWSTDPAVDFWITGAQRLNLCDNTREMYYVGWYEDFDVSVDWSLPIPPLVNPPI